VTADALLLFPGAGGNRTHPTLRAIERRLAPLPVRRRDFTYRKQGRRAPDRAPKLLGDVAKEVTLFTRRPDVGRGRIVLGGRSMGGRMASLAVADGLQAAGLVLLSYPLHPPGKPERLRTDHFAALRVPCLFVSGTRDPFGSPPEFDAHLAAIPGPVTAVWLDGQGHDPRGMDDQISDAVADWMASLR
jgi:predicted alpha/beta-hydrolase family hydrolase